MGVWIRLIPAAMATMALLCSGLYSFWCESFHIQPFGVDAVKFGPWYRQETVIEEININNNGGGGDETYYRTVETCTLLDVDSISFDSKWKTARAFGIIAFLWGSLCTIVLWFAPCLYFLSPGQWKLLALQISVLVTFFQALTFILLQSSLCDNPNELLSFWVAAAAAEGCQWDGGSTANVFSVVLWFLTGVAMMVVGVPERPPRPPAETQAVTYQKTTNADGTTTISEVAVVKGTAVTPQNDVGEKA